MPNPWALLGGLLTVIVACAFSYGFGHHVDHLAFAAYQKAQAAAAEKQVADNRSALLAQHQSDQAEMDRINQSHAEDLNEIQKRRDALLAANRNLSSRLYVSVSSPSGSVSHVPEAGASGPVDDGTGQAALSVGSAEFFIREFAQADADLATVTALQQVVAHDRQVCNGSLPGVTPAQ